MPGRIFWQSVSLLTRIDLFVNYLTGANRFLMGAGAMKKILPGLLMFSLIVFFAVVQYAQAAPSPP
jgi:hypothetical protein